MNKRFAIGSAITASLMLGAGVAVAAIPDSGTGVFTACVANNSGYFTDHHAVYLIDKQDGDTCSNGYTEKQWGGGGAVLDTHVVHLTDMTPVDPDGPTGPLFISEARRYSCPPGEVILSGFGSRFHEVGGNQAIATNPPVSMGPSESPNYIDLSVGQTYPDPQQFNIYLNCARP